MVDVQKLCLALPVLRSLPTEALRRLDCSELLVPSDALARARLALESELGVHICTYRAKSPRAHLPERLHLCRLLEPAAIRSEGLTRLREGERRFADRGVRFVAYTKPARLRLEALSPVN